MDGGTVGTEWVSPCGGENVLPGETSPCSVNQRQLFCSVEHRVDNYNLLLGCYRIKTVMKLWLTAPNWLHVTWIHSNNDVYNTVSHLSSFSTLLREAIQEYLQVIQHVPPAEDRAEQWQGWGSQLDCRAFRANDTPPVSTLPQFVISPWSALSSEMTATVSSASYHIQV